MNYSVVQLVHLFCAIAFIGVVFFEVFILDGARDKVGPDVMSLMEQGIIKRAKRIMPWFVATLFMSGVTLAWFQYSTMQSPFSSSLGLLLAIKILLAVSVLMHFTNAILATRNGCMDARRFKWTHLSLLTHMVLIVILAKAMFFVHW